MPHHRAIEDIVEIVRDAKERGKGCSLLIGAGCSVTAGVPSANGFVDIISERYPRSYERAPKKTYAACMAELTLSQRRDLIASYVDAAKINWAHICIALLMRYGFVDRVLTTNFDLLVVRACALLGEFPAIYDFAASQLFKPADIPDKAVFYLHGQRTGFILINTEEDFNKHSGLLGPVFEDAGRGRVWIVVGYSGQSDPVFEQLANVPQFDNGLFWIGYKDSEPSPHVQEKLLLVGKDAYYSNGFDADSFFITLSQKLEVFPPEIISKPFTYLDKSLEMLTPYIIPGQETQEDVTHIPRRWIRTAIKLFEDKKPTGLKKQDRAEFLSFSAQLLKMSGNYDGVIALKPEYDQAPSSTFKETLAWAYSSKSYDLLKQAHAASAGVDETLLCQAAENIKLAGELKPDDSGILNRYGIILFNQAKAKLGNEADRFFKLSEEKFQAALQIKADDNVALANWGINLSLQSQKISGAEAERLFQLGSENFLHLFKSNQTILQF